MSTEEKRSLLLDDFELDENFLDGINDAEIVEEMGDLDETTIDDPKLAIDDPKLAEFAKVRGQLADQLEVILASVEKYKDQLLTVCIQAACDRLRSPRHTRLDLRQQIRIKPKVRE